MSLDHFDEKFDSIIVHQSFAEVWVKFSEFQSQYLSLHCCKYVSKSEGRWVQAFIKLIPSVH